MLCMGLHLSLGVSFSQHPSGGGVHLLVVGQAFLVEVS